ILVNLLAAFVVFPLFLSMRYWKNIITGNYQYSDSYYEKLTDYIDVIIIRSPAYPVIPIIVLIFIFLPFQLLKDYYLGQKKSLSFFKKVLILSAIALVWLVILFSAANLLILPLYKNMIYLAYALPFGVFFAWLLYALIDRYEERLPDNIH